jgi:hypothetical protein
LLNRTNERLEKYTKEDWNEAYELLKVEGVLKGAILRRVLLSTMLLAPDTFSIGKLQQAVKHFSGEELNYDQVCRSLNTLHKRGFLKFKLIYDAYDQPFGVSIRTHHGTRTYRRYFYPHTARTLTEMVRKLLPRSASYANRTRV